LRGILNGKRRLALPRARKQLSRRANVGDVLVVITTTRQSSTGIRFFIQVRTANS